MLPEKFRLWRGYGFVPDRGGLECLRYTHTHPERVFDHSSGDEADDSYHRFRDDVRLMEDLGVGFYSHVNADGIRYYNALIDELTRKGLLPVVTMYHWDLPQSLQDLGGWTNPIVADYFVDYARVLFDSFGDRVRFWLTFNEPTSFCGDGYGGNDAPGGRSSGFEDYLCGHNGSFDFMGVNHYTTHVVAAGRGRAGPQPSFEDDVGVNLMQRDDWPKSNSTWLRVWTFITIQPTSSYNNPLVVITENGVSLEPGIHDPKRVQYISSYLKALHAAILSDGCRVAGYTYWSLMDNFEWMRGYSSYNNPLVVITENGVSLEPGIHDPKRVQYISSYLKALHAAILSDGCRVAGYTYWSLMDNFEWMRGYS
ncbi:Uncharacterized protein OBRU01_03826 [Operophtera brumata]|uniref:beta-glucosidase n=1 Tax=Operophtera brumata TaxID=104452 RepID=A0A0L7LQ81_OPEBR|nr:Uncharacterized protein OBRU01_03826 [Operophtera brumata]